MKERNLKIEKFKQESRGMSKKILRYFDIASKKKGSLLN